MKHLLVIVIIALCAFSLGFSIGSNYVNREADSWAWKYISEHNARIEAQAEAELRTSELQARYDELYFEHTYGK